MEIDRGFEVLDVAEATALSLDCHDFTVQSFRHAVGDGVAAIGSGRKNPLTFDGQVPILSMRLLLWWQNAS
jgi:hypothetical protein